MLSALPKDLRSWTKELCRQYGIRAGERLGQHFLVDARVLQKIVVAAKVSSERPVLEIGGGFGVLTLMLLATHTRVTVVELDSRLAAGLRKLAVSGPGLTVIERDILKLSEVELRSALGVSSGEFDIVANLPYEISGFFLRRFIGGPFRPFSATLLLQQEVAERLCAPPGTMSLLAVSCQLRCRPQVVQLVSPGSFLPPPRVSSAIVRLDLISQDEERTLLGGLAYDGIMRFARIGFAARRKLLSHNLASALPISKQDIQAILRQVGLRDTARAQELAISEWVALSKAITGRLGGSAIKGERA